MSFPTAVNDQITCVLNENYREPTKPYFESVYLKGGGDPASAARAVMQTGDFDFAWNLQVEPEILVDLEGAGAGTFHTFPGVLVEYLSLNFSDPRTEVNGQLSEKNTPHPILSDDAVRQAVDVAGQAKRVEPKLETLRCEVSRKRADELDQHVVHINDQQRPVAAGELRNLPDGFRIVAHVERS